MYMLFFFYIYGHHRELHGLTPSFPTRRSSDLRRRGPVPARRGAAARADSRAAIRASHSSRRRRSSAASGRSEEHTSELQSLMRNSYAVFCLKKKKITRNTTRKQAKLHYTDALHIDI